MEINNENLKNLNIKDLALNKNKFGSLTFDISYQLLEKLRSLFVEFDELDYRSNLIQQEINSIDNYKNQFLDYLKRLAVFDPVQDPNFSRNTRDGFENEVKSFYDSMFNNVRNQLVYLRQEASFRNSDEKHLQEQQKAAIQAEKEYKKLSERLEEKLKFLEEQEREVQGKQGEIAALKFGKHFEAQSITYEANARKWLIAAVIFFTLLLLIIIANFIVYFFKPELRSIFTWQYAIMKLALLSFFSYAVGFCSRQYNINSNLKTINMHRKNVAETLKDFYSSGIADELKTSVIDRGTEAMFKHLPVGYLRITEKDDGPIHQIINNIPKIKERPE